MTKIDEIRKRLEAATPGKWAAWTSEDGMDSELRVYEGRDSNAGAPDWIIATAEGAVDNDRENFTFLAAAPSDISYLLSELERYREALEKIAKRPDLPNPDRDADWKNCMKVSASEARSALAEKEDGGRK